MTQLPPTDTPPQEDAGTVGRATTRRVLNVPLLVGTLVAAAVLGAALYGWRSRQVGRIAGALLQRAEALENEEEWEKAAKCLSHYLRLRPRDARVLARLAQTYDRPAEPLGRRTRAVELYFQALGAWGEDAPIDEKRRVRCRLTELLLALSRVWTGYSALAEREALLLLEPPDKAEAWQKVRAGNPDLPAVPPEGQLWWVDHPKVWSDARGARLWVFAIDRRVKDGSFVARSSGDLPLGEHFERALELNPGDMELSIVLARIYRDQPQLLAEDEPKLTEEQRGERADTIVNNMLAANAENPEAFLARYRYRIACGLPNAKEDLDKAVHYGPANVAVLLAAAEHAAEEALRMKRQGASAGEVDAEYEEATAFCRRAIEIAPSEEDGYLDLGNVFRAQGKNDRAVKAWRRGLDACGQESLTLHSRLAEALIAQRHWSRAKEHLDALDREAMKRIPHLNRDGRRLLGSLTALLRGQWLVGQGRYAEAIPLLKRATVGHMGSDSEVAQAWQAWQLLSAVYAQRSQWDLAAAAGEEAAKLPPKDLPPHARARTLLAAANAWSMARCPAMAIPDYQQALALEDSPQTRAALARARFQRQAELPSAERNWDAFDEALTEAKARSESLAEPWRVTLLEADAMVAKAKGGSKLQQAVREAAKLLRPTEDKYPDSKPLFQTLVLVYEGLGLSADADRAMDKVDRLAGGSAAACVLRSILCSRRRQYEEARGVLAKGIRTLPPTARTQLQIALLRVSLDEGQLEAARRQLLNLHERSPTNVRFVWHLAELALERNDLGEAARWEDKLRELEGPDGSYWRYCRARRLLGQARSADDPHLAEVGELQTYIQSQRHAWPAGYVLAGLRFERHGRHQRAIAAYEKAIRLGERRISVYERLITLLYRKQRFDEARKYLSQLQDHVPSSQTLSSLDISAAAQLGDDARALQAARRGVESRPKDPRARIWLGQMLLRNGRTEEAEAALLEAVQLAPNDRRTTDSLFTFYFDTGQPDRAREALERLAENPELSSAERALALTIGYDRIGDKDASQAHYRELAQLPPDDLAVQKRLAAFLLHGDPRGAEEALRRALQLAPEDREARRTLARLLAARGGSKEWEEVQRLIGQGRSREGPSTLDRRLEAMLLVRRGGKENLRKAKRLIERLARDPEIAIPRDHLLLASLYELEGKLHAAGNEYAALVKRAEPEPEHVMSFIDFLLRHGRLYEADQWLTRLESVLPIWLAKLEGRAPDRLAAMRVRAGLDAARLKARCLRAQGRTSEIKPLIVRLADDLLKEVENAPEKKAGVLRSIGDLYSAVGQHREAEHWYQLLADLIPESYEPLAMATVRQGRIDEAIRICIKAAESGDAARAATAMVEVLASTQPSQEDLRLAERLLSRAVGEQPDNLELLTSVAHMRCLQRRIDDAVHLYELVLKRRPEDLSVLNNLATLLAEQPARRKDALDYIDKAIGIAGPKPGLLDTKGTILVFEGKAKEAVELLEEASSLGSDPRCLFHLALAYERAGEPAKARDALGKAHDGNLTGQVLTEMDKRLLTELEGKLGQ